MPNVTISLEKELIEKGREYARKKGTSLNNLIRELLSNAVDNNSHAWFDSAIELMDKINLDSKGKKWTREEIYER